MRQRIERMLGKKERKQVHIEESPVEAAPTQMAHVDEVLGITRGIPLNFIGFEDHWYGFLTNFHGFFTVLEQAAKPSRNSMDWFSEVKKFRRDDPLLLYLHKARNLEEHEAVGSVFRSGYILRPKTRGVKVRYRDAAGKRMSKPEISLPPFSTSQIEIVGPAVRLRTVYDKWGVYSVPKTYSHPILADLIHDGALELANKDNLPAFGIIALAHGDKILAEARSLLG